MAQILDRLQSNLSVFRSGDPSSLVALPCAQLLATFPNATFTQDHTLYQSLAQENW